ncbi:Protein of unknown function [Gryllus bimaculatus]|nr:Protein of unknown function [Gryllus bimaculatus]
MNSAHPGNKTVGRSGMEFEVTVSSTDRFEILKLQCKMYSGTLPLRENPNQMLTSSANSAHEFRSSTQVFKYVLTTGNWA